MSVYYVLLGPFCVMVITHHRTLGLTTYIALLQGDSLMQDPVSKENITSWPHTVESRYNPQGVTKG